MAVWREAKARKDKESCDKSQAYDLELGASTLWIGMET